MRCSSLCVLAAALAASGCFELQRGSDLTGGVITGVVLDNAGNVAPGATATVVDVGVTVTANSDGRFRVVGLPAGPHVVRLLVDADGNGAAELGLQRSVTIGTVVGGAGGVDIGAVVLEPTGSVSGRVVDSDGAGVAGASVALWRNVELDGDPLDLAADLLVESGADGRFTISGVVVGPARIAAFESVAGETTRASTPNALEVLDTGATPAGDIVLNDVDGTRRARLRFTAPVSGTVELRLARAGGVRPAEPTLTQPDVVDADSVTFLVPFGVWDVYVNVGDAAAQLRSQVAPAFSSEDEVAWGVVALRGGAPAPGAACGDGIIDVGEQCDDGNGNGPFADACRADCSAPDCGDGVIDSGESCDDGDANSDVEPDACRTSCTAPVCGDGVIDAGEGCDDGDANALTCTPDLEDCSWCDAVTCSVGTIEARAELTVDVRSVQGWGLLPVAGVTVTVQGVERQTTSDGTATFVLDLPVSAEPILVGGAEQGVAGRSWVGRALPMPQLRHLERATVSADVYEGCRMFVDETTESDPQFDKAPFGNGLVLDLASHAGCNTLQRLRFEVGGQLVDAQGAPATTFSVRAAAATSVFTDPEAFAGFPPTIAADGAPLMCSALFEIEFDDGVHIDPTIDASRLRPLSVGGTRAWRFDVTQGAFVEVDGVYDEGTGFGLPSGGLWCLGEPAAPSECIVVDVVDDTGAPVADARVDVVAADEVGTTLHRGGTGADGSSNCFDVSLASTVVAVEGPNGARASFSGVEFGGEGASCALDDCTHVAITLQSAPFESCLVVQPAINFGKGFVTPNGTLLVREPGNNGQRHRGSIPWTSDVLERCIAVPNRGSRFAFAFEEDEDSVCAFGVNDVGVDTSDQAPSTEPPVCGSEDCTTVDLNFFCSGS